MVVGDLFRHCMLLTLSACVGRARSLPASAMFDGSARRPVVAADRWTDPIGNAPKIRNPDISKMLVFKLALGRWFVP